MCASYRWLSSENRQGPLSHRTQTNLNNPIPYAWAVHINGAGIVITGAARGIGAGLARHFHALGARVVLTDVLGAQVQALAEELDQRRPGSAWAVIADVSTEEGNRLLIAESEQLLSNPGSGIDLFFANAGVGSGTVLETTTEAEWQTAFAVNVHAHRWAAKYLIPRWVERGSGYFCSTASAAGLLSQIGSIPYSVTKSAAVAFAESLAITYGDQGVRVSCLCPQGVNTDMLRQGDSFGAGPATDVVRASGEVLEPEQVAEVVAAAIEAERFLILPHPQVADFETRKTADRDRWLAGMRKLQARIVGRSSSKADDVR